MIRSTITGLAGTNSSGLTKWVKDFVADALISGAAALGAAQVVTIPSDKAQATVATFAIAGAIIHALYRSVLKWATS